MELKVHEVAEDMKRKNLLILTKTHQEIHKIFKNLTKISKKILATFITSINVPFVIPNLTAATTGIHNIEESARHHPIPLAHPG